MTYTEGNVTIAPETQSIVYTITGTNFANVSDDNYFSFTVGLGTDLTNSGFTVDTDANTATMDYTGDVSDFGLCDGFEVEYSNDGKQTYIGTGIYLTYDDGSGDTATMTRPPRQLTIVTQPVSVYTDIGGSVRITVEAIGDGLTYQWYYKNDGDTEFKTSVYIGKTYSMTLANFCDGREVYCIITDQYGKSATTDTAVMSSEEN